jgi:two-component system, sensor histidine kinase PdtaS
VIHSSDIDQVEKILAQHIARLQASLQHASGDISGPEEGSDAWLLLNAFINNDRPALIDRFEQSGWALAEQGGKIEARIQGLQSYIDALAHECKELFNAENEQLHLSAFQLSHVVTRQ